MFGEPGKGQGATQVQPPASDAEGPDAERLSGLTKNAFESGEQVEDPLKIGGQFYLQSIAGFVEATRFKDSSLRAPTLIDVYMDARPSERLRAMVVGRLSYDPTLPADATTTRLRLGRDPGQPGGAARPGVAALRHRAHRLRHRRQAAREVGHRVHLEPDRLPLPHPAQPAALLRPAGRLVDAEVPHPLGGEGLELLRDRPARQRRARGHARQARRRRPRGDRARRVRARPRRGVREGQAPTLRRRLLRGARARSTSTARRRSGSGATSRSTRRHPTLRTRSTLDQRRRELGARSFRRRTRSGFNPQVTVGGTWTIPYAENDTVIVGAEYFYNDARLRRTPTLYPVLIFNRPVQPVLRGQAPGRPLRRASGPGELGQDDRSPSSTWRTSPTSRSRRRLNVSVRVLSYLTLEAYGAVHFGHTEARSGSASTRRASGCQAPAIDRPDRRGRNRRADQHLSPPLSLAAPSSDGAARATARGGRGSSARARR